jgi:hypothetical protein
MHYHNPSSRLHSESYRRGRRSRRRMQRARLVPMEGLRPRRAQSLPRWVIKHALKRYHCLQTNRHWGNRPTR